MRNFKPHIAIALLLGVVLFFQQTFQAAQAQSVKRIKVSSGSQYLIVEALNDNLIHFELSALGPGPSVSSPIYTSPMVDKIDYSGPTSWNDTTAGPVRTLETTNIKVDVDTSTLCATVTDKVKALTLTTYCSPNLGSAWKSLTMTPESFKNGYGLGAEYVMAGTADGDWVQLSGIRSATQANSEMR